MELDQIIVYLTPFIIWLAGFIVVKVKPLIPGWLMLTVIAGLTSAVTYLTQTFTNPDLNWIWQFLLGLFAILIAQIITLLSPTKIRNDNSEVRKARDLI